MRAQGYPFLLCDLCIIVCYSTSILPALERAALLIQGGCPGIENQNVRKTNFTHLSEFLILKK